MTKPWSPSPVQWSLLTLQSAKVYVSVFNTDNKLEVMAAMDENIHRLRHALAGKVGKQLRKIPELKFYPR